ncbi:MAG: NfeD family protein [Cyanobacteria bacterium J06626_4]
MSLLNTFFSPEVGEANFLETTYPLTDDLFGDDSIAWHSDDEALAVVKTDIEPGQLGRVKFQGVRWRAYCDRALTIPLGTEVRVLGRRANILVVEPMSVSAIAS